MVEGSAPSVETARLTDALAAIRLCEELVGEEHPIRVPEPAQGLVSVGSAVVR